MSQDCGQCPSASACSGAAEGAAETCAGYAVKEQTEAQKHTNIRHIIVVMSGKGGVGKSSFSSLLALSLKRAGHRVGLLDADITGPSIPKIFGLNTHPPMGEHGMEPLESAEGVAVMSINLLLPNEDDPVVWRGALMSGVIHQFMEEVCWGEVDYLIVDMPPGTGDVPLTILQSLPVDGAIIVTTPQSLSNMIVRKGMKMLNMMHIPALGIAENMSYLSCPDCSKEIEIFGESHVARTAETFEVPLLGRFPLDPELAKFSDRGQIESYRGPVREQMEKAAGTLVTQLAEKQNA